MSYATGSQPARILDDAADYGGDGQRHDRIPLAEQDSTMAGSGDVEISVTQRMVSATWGSILTALLGVLPNSYVGSHHLLTMTVTPLDVVRVRLQSQNLPTPKNLSRFPAYSASFKKLPPDLGVTACCKEVFWVNNNAEFCLVAENGATTATTAVAECAAEESRRKTFNSTLDGMKKIARNEGPLTLWRGLSPTLAMAIPANVIYFTGYDWLRYNQKSPIQQIANDTYAPLVAGSVARVAAAVVVSPIEMFRTRMQATSGSNGVFRGTLLGLRRMTQSQGYTSLWRGLSLTMWRDVPFSGIYWWGYEAIRNSLTDAREAKKGRLQSRDLSTVDRKLSQSKEAHGATFVDSFLAGAGSGAVASLVTTPFDVGKTRQQVYRHAGDDVESVAAARAAKSSGRVVPEEMTMPRFLYHIFKEEGPSGLFKGWAARCLKVAPACAIMISSYEVGKRWARDMNEKQKEQQV